MILSLFIPGIPKPAGSKRPFLIRNKTGAPVFKNGRPLIVVTDTSGKAGKDWRADVRAAVQTARAGAPLESGSLTVHMTFYMPRPKSHYGTGKNASVLKDSAPKFYEHLQDPDALKLARAVEDALTGVLWVDDNQLRGAQQKLWSREGKTGMLLTVEKTTLCNTGDWERNSGDAPCQP